MKSDKCLHKLIADNVDQCMVKQYAVIDPCDPGRAAIVAIVMAGRMPLSWYMCQFNSGSWFTLTQAYQFRSRHFISLLSSQFASVLHKLKERISEIQKNLRQGYNYDTFLLTYIHA